MRVMLIIIFTVSSCLLLNGQNYIYKGENKYESTNSWEFKSNSYNANPEIVIAKQSSGGGYLMISVEIPWGIDYIGGTVVLFLIDGTTIKCTDKGIRDNVDEKSIALYSLTKSEIELLKNMRIVKIRYSIMNKTGGATQSYTAENKKYKSLSLYYDFKNENKEKDYYETDIEIAELFH